MKTKSLLLFAAGTLLLSGCSKAEKLASYKNKVSAEVFSQKLENKFKSHKKLNSEDPYSFTLTYVDEEKTNVKYYKDGKKLSTRDEEENVKYVYKYNHKNSLYSIETKTEVDIDNSEEETESEKETEEIYQAGNNCIYTFDVLRKFYDETECKSINPKDVISLMAMKEVEETVDTAKFIMTPSEGSKCYVDKNDTVFTIVSELNSDENWDKYKVKVVYQLIINDDEIALIYYSDIKKERDSEKDVYKTRSSQLIEFDEPSIKKQDIAKYESSEILL